MCCLADLQRSFSSYLLSPPEQPAGAELTASVRRQGLDANDRLAIYKNNVYARLIEALEASYPVVHRLVGEEFFRFTARHYIPAHPPESPTLLGYGAGFPEFLRAFEPAGSVPYLPDVARLEQLYLDSYHAAEAHALPKHVVLAQLAAIAAGARPALHPSARLMTSRFPVSRIWEVNRQQNEIDGPVQIPAGAEYLLIIRPRETVEVRRVSLGAYIALSALANGSAIAEALDAGGKADPGTDVVAHLTSLAEGETFTSGEHSNEPSRQPDRQTD